MAKKIVLSLLITLAFVVIGGVTPIADEKVMAAPDATSMCVPIGVIGTVIIGRCEDEDTNTILYVNSAGFMMLGE